MACGKIKNSHPYKKYRDESLNSRGTTLVIRF